MSGTPRKKFSTGWLVVVILMGLTDLALLIRRFMHGHNIALFNPKGYIAQEQHSLMVYSITLLMIIAVPSILLFYFTAWKYRETNTRAAFEPDKKHGKLFNFTVWALPAAFMLMLAVVMIPATHQLQPRNSIAAATKPLTIQVISLRWKWLFIYPEQQIATVNFVQLPVDTPVQFELTADEAPMSSFWIPNLGGQLYSMTGHVNRLNLMADTMGDFPGSSAEINGTGFAGMKFTARVGSYENFSEWVQTVRQSPEILDRFEYADILKPSEENSAAFYSAYESDLYDKVVLKYTGTAEGHQHGE